MSANNPKVSARSATARKSPYTEFMIQEIADVKAAYPGLDHKDAFKVAAVGWKLAQTNPRNQGRDPKILLEERYAAEESLADKLLEEQY